MGTTALVVELLIVGFQVTTWIVLLLIWGFGYEWIDLDLLTPWAGLLTVVFLAASYTLGLVFDAVLLEVTRPLSNAVQKVVGKAITKTAGKRGIPLDHELPVTMRMYVIAQNPNLEGYFARTGFGFRLLMAATVNLVLVGMCGSFLLATRLNCPVGWIVALLCACLLAAGFCAYAWYIKYRYYCLELGLTYLEIRAPKAPLPDKAQKRR